MKTLVVPMHSSIGSAVPSYLERNFFHRVILVHPWSENGAAHHNAQALGEYFRSRLQRYRLQQKDPRDTLFKIEAMNCSQKPLEISDYFGQSIRRDFGEVNNQEEGINDSGPVVYDVLLVDETPVGYTIGTMNLSAEAIPVKCHITSLGYDIRKPLRHEFNPEKRIGETFEEIPLIGQIHDTKEMLRKRPATSRVLKTIHEWYYESGSNWQAPFKMKEISEFSEQLHGKRISENVIANHMKFLIDNDPGIIVKHGQSNYQISRFGRSIAWDI